MSLSSLFAAVIPLFCGLFGAVLSNVPISLTGGEIPPPLLSFMAVYFWCLFRPDLMPAAAVFVIGFSQDLLSGTPIGFWTVSYLASYAFLDWQRDSFAALAGIGAVLGFALAMLILSTAVYGVATLYFWQLPPMVPLVLQLAVSVVCYVAALPLLNGLQHGVIGPLRSEF